MSNKIVISEIEIIPIKPNNGLVGFASCSIFESFHVGSIGIYTAPRSASGFRLVYPTKVLKSGQQVPCFHPYTKEAEEEMTRAIASKYIEIMTQ